EEGEYTVEVDIDFISGDCVPDDTVIVEFLPTPDLDDVGEPGDITACVAAGVSYSFDLTENDDTILNEYDPEDYVITYHTTEEDAEEGENAIEDPENHVADCETIWARIEGFANGESTGCYEVVSFEICTGGINVGELDDLEACYDEVAENAFFDLTQNDENALDGLSNEN